MTLEVRPRDDSTGKDGFVVGMRMHEQQRSQANASNNE